MNYPWDFHRHIRRKAILEEIFFEEKNALRPSLICSAGKEDWETLVEVSKKATQHKTAIGIHPWSTQNKTAKELESEFEKLELLIKDNRNSHIGETGMDSLRGAPLEIQKDLFKKHLELAYIEKRLCVIHCVRTYSDLLGILNKLYHENKLPKCMVHYYSGSPEIAEKLNGLGVAMSFNISQTNDNAEFREKLAKSIERAEWALFESDEEGDLAAAKTFEKFDLHFPRKVGALQWTVKAQSFWNSL